MPVRHLAFDVIHIIRKLFTTCQDIIVDYDGRVIETAGDGLYAAFGFSGDNVSAVQSAVQSSLSILTESESLNENYFQLYFNHKIEVGIGLHVGKVVTGNIRLGADDRFIVMEYPVTIAARLQSMTWELNNNVIVFNDVFLLLQEPPGQHSFAVVDLKGVSGVSRFIC